jgi:hypothetical protein
MDAKGQAQVTMSCEECAAGPGPSCEDCVVSFLLDDDAPGAVVLAADELRALRLLASHRLVPRLRFERRAG